MYQRLLLILSVLFISATAMSQDEKVMAADDGDYIYDASAAVDNPLHTNPSPDVPAGQVQKWVHQPNQTGKSNRILWDQTAYKSYRLNGVSFRLRFPKGYDSSNHTVKYPMVIFLHGAGEAANRTLTPNLNGANRENQDQLYWGAEDFSNLITNNKWNGYLLFPQQTVNGSGAGAEWAASTITPLNDIIDKLVLNNNVDQDRITTMGLSAGGFGSVNYADLFPTRIAAVVSSCPEGINGSAGRVDRFIHVPIWMAAGGIDTGPDPGMVLTFRNAFAAQGGDLYLSYYPTLAHQVWDTQWNRKDKNNNLIMVSYWNSANKAQPLVYGQNTQICNGQAINVKMGVSPGFLQYKWQKDIGAGFVDISGATTNTYTTNEAGAFRVQFQHTDGSWSAWTPNPVVISNKACNLTDTAYVEHFESNPNTYYTTFNNGTYNANASDCFNGMFVNATQAFSQDATGRQGGRFLLNGTRNFGSCTYVAGGLIWRTYPVVATVTPQTDYVFSFYIGNQTTGDMSNPATAPYAKISAFINDNNELTPTGGVSAVLQGNVSWKKYSYIWNSGSNTQAWFSLTNNSTNTDGNDFAIDEISLVKYKAPSMPGGAFKNATLWAKANTIPGVDGNPVAVWTNDDINGNSLQQVQIGRQPILKNNAANNINFNPIVSYNPANNLANYAPGGFAGTAKHGAAHVYAVTNVTNFTSTLQTIIREDHSGGNPFDIRTSLDGTITWRAAGVTLATNANAIEANKPALWTFSKDTLNFTGDNNHQDIRKNGILLTSSNNTKQFTGINADFTVGTSAATGINSTYDGGIAELIVLYDSTVTAAKENQIESYLSIKYGTTLGNTGNPRNYTASNGAIVWPSNGNYQNDVFGIGRDSLSSLLQPKSNSSNSGSGDGTGQFAKGNLVLTANSTLADRTFLMIGNNAGPLTEQTISDATQGPIGLVGSTRIRRNWKIANTGTITAVTLSFDTTGLFHLAGGPDLSKYALMIDLDGDGNFGTGSINTFPATGMSGKKLLFAGVVLPDNAVFTVITNKTLTALPAVWLGFTATAVNGNALLNWKTSDEVNVDHYVAEHSFNGVSFSPVGTVTANNNSGVNNYTLTDYNLAAGLHYYRIRRVDKDGKYEYSDIKSVKITTNGANVQVRPNPVTGNTLQLTIAVQQNTKTAVQVLSADGKLLLRQNVSLSTGGNLVNLNIDFVPSGIYFVQVLLSDEMVTKKFIRQH